VRHRHARRGRVALTLVPAVLTVGSRFGLCDPKRKMAQQRWRGSAQRLSAGRAHSGRNISGRADRPGDASGLQNELRRPVLSTQNLPANLGMRAGRHFSQSRMLPDILMIEADHDMRNPADFLVLHKLAKAIFALRAFLGCRHNRPEEHRLNTSIPFLISMQNAAMLQNMEFMKARVNDC